MITLIPRISCRDLQTGVPELIICIDARYTDIEQYSTDRGIQMSVDRQEFRTGWQGAASEVIRAEGKWQQRLLESIIEGTNDGLVVVDSSGIVLLANPVAQEILQVREADLVGRRLRDTNPGLVELDELNRSGDFSEKLVTLPSSEDVSARIVGISITRFSFRDQEYSLFDLRDQTWNAKLENRVTQQERRYSSLIEHSPLGVFSCNAEGRITSVNSVLPTMLGIPPDDTLEGVFVDSSSVLNESGITRNVYSCLETGKPVVTTHSFGNERDGPIHLTVHCSPLTVDSGEPVGVQAVIENNTEQEKTRSSLEMSEERYKVFFQNAPISLWEADFSAVQQFFDSRRKQYGADFEHYFKRHPEDLIRCMDLIRLVDVNPVSLALYDANTVAQLMDAWPSRSKPETYYGYRQLFSALAEGRTTCRFEVEDTTLTGRRMYLSVSAAVVPGYESDLSKILFSILDITKTKQMEIALHKQLVLERSIARISTRFINLQPTGTASEIKRAFEEIGAALAFERVWTYQINEDGILTVSHEWQRDDNQRPATPFEARSLDDYPWFATRLARLETVYVADVRELPTEARLERAVLGDAGMKMLLILPLVVQDRLKGMLCFSARESLKGSSRDTISLLRIAADAIAGAIDREQRKRELRDSKDLLRTVFDSLGSGVIVTDSNGKVLLANPSSLEHLHIEECRDLIGYRIDEVVAGAEPLLRDASPGEQQQTILTLKDGSKSTIGYTSASVARGQQRIIVFRDLTIIIETGKRQKRAEQLASVGMMVAKLSHEIKNPLTSILLGLRTLETNTFLRSEDNFILQSTLEEVRFLKSLIGNLLDSTRYQDVSPSPARIEPLVRECVDSQVHLAAHRGVALNTNEGPVGTRLCVDGKAMSRALANLVQNALEACEKGHAVQVGWRLLSDEEKQERLPGYTREVVCLFVWDDGPGLPQEVMDNLFVPFTTTKTHGTGLGLPMVREVVSGHGGVIDVFNRIYEDDRGTRFEILLAGGDRPSCLDVHGGCDDGNQKCCPIPEGCPVRENEAFYACWAVKSKASLQESGHWHDECETCEAFLAGNLERYHRRANPGGQRGR